MKNFWDYLETEKYSTYSDILLAMAREKLSESKTEEGRQKIRGVIVGIKNLKIVEKI